MPMLVVMSNGLTDGSWAGGSSVEDGRYLEELLKDIIPLIESRYRVKKSNLAELIAGLSNGWWPILCDRSEIWINFLQLAVQFRSLSDKILISKNIYLTPSDPEW